jgi:hypothetical protein
MFTNQAAEVDRRFDVARVTTQPLGLDVHVEGAAAGRRPQRLGQAAVHEQWRVDAMGEVPQLLDGVLDADGQHVQHLGGRLRVVGQQVPGEAQVDGQRHQVLLGAVVQVPLDLAALGVGGGHDAGP